LSLLGCHVKAEGLRKVVKARNVGGDINSSAKDDQNRVFLVRNIRPMKKLRRPAGQVSVPGLGSKPTSPSVGVGNSSTVNSTEETLWPARIICIRVEECDSITEEEALSLRDLGVEDVVWSDAK